MDGVHGAVRVPKGGHSSRVGTLQPIARPQVHGPPSGGPLSARSHAGRPDRLAQQRAGHLRDGAHQRNLGTRALERGGASAGVAGRMRRRPLSRWDVGQPGGPAGRPKEAWSAPRPRPLAPRNPSGRPLRGARLRTSSLLRRPRRPHHGMGTRCRGVGEDGRPPPHGRRRPDAPSP